jgi:hypothetical protein
MPRKHAPNLATMPHDVSAHDTRGRGMTNATTREGDLAMRLVGGVWGHLVGDAVGVPYVRSRHLRVRGR